MTHEEAKALIEPTGLTAACNVGDRAAVLAVLDTNPGLVEALNALTPKPGEETPQRAAARCRHIPVLELFLERGVMPDLFTACALGKLELVDAYLKAHPKDINAAGAHGIQLMVHANHPAMVSLLLDRGADPTVALAQLSWSGRVELMDVALKRGAKINEPKVGRRPLHIACARGHLEAVKYLLANGAEIDARSKGADWERKTPLALANMGNHVELVAFLHQYLLANPIPPKPGVPRFGGPIRRPSR